MRLPAVLASHDLPLVELQAARLDGELYAVDDAFSPLDEPDGPNQRAAALAFALPVRFIAERRSAAWIHGALSLPPQRHELCVDISARRRPERPDRHSLREVVLDGRDLMFIGPLRVTTPVRTAVDLAREPETDAEAAAITDAVIGRLMRAYGIDLAACRDLVDRRRNLPGKRAAMERLAACDPVHVVDGVDAANGVQHPGPGGWCRPSRRRTG